MFLSDLNSYTPLFKIKLESLLSLQNMSILDDENMTVEECHIEEGHQLLIESK